MNKILLLGLSLVCVLATMSTAAGQKFETDVIKTSKGDLAITFIGHATLMMSFDGMNIYVDPITQLADYSDFPKADLILITHEHPDHFDLKAIDQLKTVKTEIISTETVAAKLKGVVIMENGEVKTICGLEIKAVPAYNIVHMRSPGVPFHPKGIGNGYVVTFGDKLIYIAGDTENIPEMSSLKNIDIAFLPMNLPPTMTPEMVAAAAKSFQPKVLYPYHYGDTDTSKIVELLKDDKNIEVRIRRMK
jgi:L-ascorbate metabolism protein UlaG (beta-lactamase superfamily)